MSIYCLILSDTIFLHLFQIDHELYETFLWRFRIYLKKNGIKFFGCICKLINNFQLEYEWIIRDTRENKQK